MLALGWLATSCSSGNNEVEEVAKVGSGTIALTVAAEDAFANGARAVDETPYKNVNNYTVQILQGDTKVKEFKYGEKADTYELSNGNYTLVAFYGTESICSRTGFYVTGSSAFSINGNTQNVTVSCAPTCGRMAVNFDTKMADYFENYYVAYETAAIKEAGASAVWGKDDTDPWYLRLNAAGEVVKATVNYTLKSTGKTYQILKEYAMKPNQAWTLNVVPNVIEGKLILTITIDESTDDKPIDIEVPSDWI